jgi:hypothetical protein
MRLGVGGCMTIFASLATALPTLLALPPPLLLLFPIATLSSSSSLTREGVIASEGWKAQILCEPVEGTISFTLS